MVVQVMNTEYSIDQFPFLVYFLPFMISMLVSILIVIIPFFIVQAIRFKKLLNDSRPDEITEW